VDEGCISPCRVFQRQLLLNDSGNQPKAPPVFGVSLQYPSYAYSLGPEMHLEGEDADGSYNQFIPRYL